MICFNPYSQEARRTLTFARNMFCLPVVPKIMKERFIGNQKQVEVASSDMLKDLADLNAQLEESKRRNQQLVKEKEDLVRFYEQFIE